jgi:hypothetical protein
MEDLGHDARTTPSRREDDDKAKVGRMLAGGSRPVERANFSSTTTIAQPAFGARGRAFNARREQTQ